LDITGEIHSGMWSYGDPFPTVQVKPVGDVDWVKYRIYAEVFDGLNSQSGTYLETPAHLLGEDSYPLIDVTVDKLVDIPTVILNLGEVTGAVTTQMLENCPAAKLITKGCAILVGTEYGKKWKNENYVTHGPYITYDAMKWLISKEPFLLGSDFPRWDNLQRPQGFWQEFYDADILMLAPCVDLELAEKETALLTVLPIKVEKTCCAPCRAILKFD